MAGSAPELARAAEGPGNDDCSGYGVENIRGYRVLANPAEHQTDGAGLVAELRGKGVRDNYVMKTGDYAGQVALGFFSRRDNATARVAALEDLGFRAQTVPVLRNSPPANCGAPGQTASATGTPAATAPAASSATEAIGDTMDADTSTRSAGTPAPDRAVKPETRQTVASRTADCTPSASAYIVLADPAENGNDTLALVYQLRASGVDDLFVVTADRHRGQIALGIFDDQQQAGERVDALTAQGFRVRSERHMAANPGADCPP